MKGAAALRVLHRELEGCSACPKMVGPVVHGPPVVGGILSLGQAPGPHEARIGHPFAWTAGKTLFRWMERLGISEADFRARIYMAAVARCFPGKAKGGGDRVPDAGEIVNCRRFLEREVAILQPRLVIPIGGLAIEQVLGERPPLVEVIGRQLRRTWHGVEMDVIALPHPSGASTWFKVEPGKRLLAAALRLLARHPEVRRAFATVSAGSPAREAARPARC
jgi:uracil-DNA glycosylase